MRISDWSSDVCSSDLQAPGVDAGDVLEHVGLDAEAVEGGLEPRVDLIAGQASRRIDVGEVSDGNVLDKHGLAAGLRTKGNPCYRVDRKSTCKERVCQYVENLVVAVSV